MKYAVIFCLTLSFSFQVDAQQLFKKNILSTSVNYPIITALHSSENISFRINYNRTIIENFGISLGFARTKITGDLINFPITCCVNEEDFLRFSNSNKNTYSIAANYLLALETKHFMLVGLGLNHNRHAIADALNTFSTNSIYSQIDYHYQLFRSFIIGGSLQVEPKFSEQMNISTGVNFSLMF